MFEIREFPSLGARHVHLSAIRLSESGVCANCEGHLKGF